MREHCFYCWNDATHTDGAILLCSDHAPDDAARLLKTS